MRVLRLQDFLIWASVLLEKMHLSQWFNAEWNNEVNLSSDSQITLLSNISNCNMIILLGAVCDYAVVVIIGDIFILTSVEKLTKHDWSQLTAALFIKQILFYA